MKPLKRMNPLERGKESLRLPLNIGVANDRKAYRLKRWKSSVEMAMSKMALWRDSSGKLRSTPSGKVQVTSCA